MGRGPDALGNENRVLVFIAGSVVEARRVETALTSAGIDYRLEAEEFTQGILSSMRTGLGFYVVGTQAPVARRRLDELNLQSGIIDADPGEQKALADIEQYGCHVVHVLAEDELPPFSYSVGIQRSSGAPELIVIGLKRPLGHFIVNEYNRRVRTGERFAAGQIASGFIEGFNCHFRPVHSSHHRAYLGWDVWLYHGELQVLQLVYPTTAGVWPWDSEADDQFRAWQPLLEKPEGDGAR
jgi:Domain of unknown function (DUF4262)